MKVLLIKDVYKLGRAGDVKKVADGYGRNFLLPQAMAVLATPGALKQVDHIRTKAAARRAEQNNEMGGLATQLQGVYITFPSKAGETGKLYGSITTAMIAEALSKKIGTPVERRHVECQPIRNLGKFKAIVRLTVDLNPEVLVIVHREGEVPELPEELKPVEVPAEVPAAE